MALVDWDLATSTAGRLGPTGPVVSLEEATSVVTDLRQLAREAEGHVAAFTGLTPTLSDAPVAIVDRRGWAAENVAGLRTVIGPLTDKLARQVTPVASAVGSKVAGVQAGLLLAFLSGKVLGQYEVFGNDPGRLLLVAPNIVAVERKLSAVPRDFRLWVCLHEMTHRIQFTGVPWLREHFLTELRAFVDAAEPPGQMLRNAGKLFDAARGSGSILDAVQTPAQKAVLDRLTALLTLLEGHAEVVMDGVGPTVIPTVETIRASFERRRHETSPLEAYLRRLFGMDIKLKQYTQGRAFVAAVVAAVGMQRFNRIFTSPETLPTLAEIEAPLSWVDRVSI